MVEWEVSSELLSEVFESLKFECIRNNTMFTTLSGLCQY